MVDEKETAEELAKVGVDRGSTLYIFPWQPVEGLPHLCQLHYKCIHRGAVDAALDLAYNEQALLVRDPQSWQQISTLCTCSAPDNRHMHKCRTTPLRCMQAALLATSTVR
jgi:hypothetical protein